ncbi:ShlB/FhaC/HecB family hemolysin secretion/activation protein [Zavarzinia sp.]|uniref:ShlB/FhaC/HecB family hemolysin secretion/activation protein n=1 Tax=Zavarzinia sp. TaxID=2027920 RepID=UPI003BB63065|nr:hypothetical protein [Zavarzinia sp.]
MLRAVVIAAPCLLGAAGAARAEEASAPAGDERRIDIWEYRIEGTHALAQTDVERAVYPFLGPHRRIDEVERARASLEKAYADRGYQTVAVEIPAQDVKDGVVLLKVVEGAVGRLRVRGARYYSLDQIKAEAPSLAEGSVPDFTAVTQDITGLNQQPDRRVTPSLRAGVAPGTVDVDLMVEDRLPFHGSLELNNGYSANTKPLRLNASLRYENLWQLGHSLTLGFQVAPEDRDDGEVYSASYLARFPRNPAFSLLVYGVKNESDISTLGGTNVVGRGETLGLRGLVTLPGGADDFFHQASVGLDYKHFEELVGLGDAVGQSAPVTYFPVTADYTGTWSGEGEQTDAGIGLTFNLRGLGSGQSDFQNKRADSRGDFVYLRGHASHTRELPAEFQLFARIEGQVSDQPLVSSEEISAGGLDTVRGYLESESLGDNGVIGRLELRGPNLQGIADTDWSAGTVNEWRFHVFADGALLAVLKPGAEQDDDFSLASVGVGSQIRLLDYLNGVVDLGVPLVDQSNTRAGDPRLHFRVWGEF